MLCKSYFKGLSTQALENSRAQACIPLQSSVHATTDAPTRSVCATSLNTYQICMPDIWLNPKCHQFSKIESRTRQRSLQHILMAPLSAKEIQPMLVTVTHVI